MWKRLFLAIFILLSFEVGFFLILVPWTPTWENNYFMKLAAVQEIALSPFVRGAVSGLGLLNIFLGLGEAWHFRERIGQMEAHEARNPPVEEQTTEKTEKPV